MDIIGYFVYVLSCIGVFTVLYGIVSFIGHLFSAAQIQKEHTNRIKELRNDVEELRRIISKSS